jgi:hypothetical protein
MLLSVTAGISAGCTSWATYACSDDAGTRTEQLIVDLGEFSTISDPGYMHDCDSGGPIYVSFDVTRFEAARAEVMDKAKCEQGDAKGFDLSEGDLLLRCTFPSAGATEVLLSTQPLGGSAQVIEARP